MSYNLQLMGLQAKSYRFDDEVRARIALLREVYGTDNAAMRFMFGLSGHLEPEAVSVVDSLPVKLKKEIGDAILNPKPAPKGESIINRLRRERGYGPR